MKLNGNLKFLSLGASELQNAIIERLASDPTGGGNVAGRLYYNTTDNEYRYYNGTGWSPIGEGATAGNVVTGSGGIYNSDGTYDGATVDAALSQVTSSTDLLDALTQLNNAITAAAGVDTMQELTDTTGDITDTAAMGDIVFWNGTAWDNTGFSAEPTDNYLLQWNATSNIWEVVAPSTIGGNSFGTINGDSGSATADTTSDTLTLSGATNGGITTVAANDPESITFAITPVDLATGAATLAGGDFIIVSDSGDGAGTTALKYTFNDMLTDLAILVDGDIGVTVQAYDAGLASLAGLSAVSGDIIYATAADTYAVAQPGATSGVQPYDADLATIAGLAPGDGNVLLSSGSAWTIATATSIGRTRLEDLDDVSADTTGSPEDADNSILVYDAATNLYTAEDPATARTSLGLVAGGAGDIWVEKAGDTMTGDLTMGGTATQIFLNAGFTYTNPDLSWAGDTDTGIILGGANAIGFGTGGAQRMSITSTNISSQVQHLFINTGTASAPSMAFSGDTNTGIYRIEADVLGFSAGGAERLRIYGSNVGSPTPDETGAISVEATANYEALIGDPSGVGFTAPVDDFLPNAQWVDLYYLRKSGGTMTGNLTMSSAEVLGLPSVPSGDTAATSKAYVDGLVTSGTKWRDPIVVPDLIDIVSTEPGSPIAHDTYIYTGASTTWTGSVSVTTGDVVEYQTTGWVVLKTLEQGDRFIISGESPTTAGSGLTSLVVSNGPVGGGSTALADNDLIEYTSATITQAAITNAANWNRPDNTTDAPPGPDSGVTVISAEAGGSYHFGHTYHWDGTTWHEIAGPGAFTAGNGIDITGNTISVDQGAGLEFDSSTRLRVDLYNSSSGGLILTDNGTNRVDNNASAQLHLLLSATGGLDQGTAGLFIKAAGVTNAMLANSTLTIGGDAGTPQTVALGDAVDFVGDGTTGISVSAGTAGSPATSTLTFSLSSVPNSALANSSITITGDSGSDAVALGETLTVDGNAAQGVSTSMATNTLSITVADATTTTKGVASFAAANFNVASGAVTLDTTQKIYRIEDTDGDTFVQVDSGADNDTINLTTAGGTSATLSTAEFDITSAGAVDINAGTAAAVTINGGDATSGNGGGVILTAGNTSDEFGNGGAVTITAGINTDGLASGVNGDVTLETQYTSGGGAGNVYVDTGTLRLTGNRAVTSGRFQIYDNDSSHYLGFTVPATITSSLEYTLPEAPAADGYVMVSTTAGIMSWVSPDSIGRSRLEDLDDVVADTTGSPSDSIGNILVKSETGSPATPAYVSQAIQFNYDSTLHGGAATSHTVTHNLGQQFVNVTVYEQGTGSPVTYTQVLPQSVTLDSANQLTVTFNTAINCVVVVTGVPGVPLA